MRSSLPRTETRDVAPQSTRALIAPDTIDRDARTVEVVWTTGARVLRGYYDKFWEELSLDPKHVRLERLNSGSAPVLMDHDASHVARTVGVVEAGSVRLTKTEGRARIRFVKAGVDPEADQLFEKVADGVANNVSVGYRIWRLTKTEESADGVPVYLADDYEPFEVSVVAIGSDAGAGFRSADARQSNQCTLVVREEKDAMSGAGAGAVQNDATRAVQLERERCEGIRHAGKAGGMSDAFVTEHVNKGTALDVVRGLVITALAARSDAQPINGNIPTDLGSGISVGDSDADKFVRHASAWLFERAGNNVVERAVQMKAKGFERLELDGGPYRGMSALDLARECLHRAGVSTRGMGRFDVMGKALTHRSGGLAGTTDFPVLLENVMGKILLGAYATTPDTWTKFCKQETVSDFKDSPRYRTGSFGVLDSLDEHGEFRNKAIPDGQKTAINVATKGNMIGITRQALINDDMGALAALPAQLGRAAKLSIEADVYALLALNAGLGSTQDDGQPFFHSSRGNVSTGAAMSIAALDADRVHMAKQKDISGNEYLDLRPAVLVVPIALGGDAREFNRAEYDTDGSKFQKPNRVRGLFSDIADTPRLSGTRRYLFADPAVCAAIVVAFLEGQGQGPTLETEQGWRVDGTEMKVRMDYKAQMFDVKGAVTNAGI